MNTKIEETKLAPPRLIPTLLAGFNTVANHLALLLFPLGLDLLIWFGPRIKLENFLKPIYAQAIQTLSAYNNAELQEILETSFAEIETVLGRINLVSNISTFPIGVPSLLSGQGIEKTPIGSPIVFDLDSFGSIVLISLLLFFLGIVFGSLYLSAIAFSTSKKNENFTFEVLGKKILKGLGLALLLILIVIVMTFPILFVVSLFSLFSPVLSQIVLLISTFVLIWLIIPLIFSPHGIFANNMGIIQSILYSIKVVRSYLPGTGMFLLAAILIAQGLDLLWIAAPADSWLTLVGITGHAFIYTALIAASFIYYQKSSEWTSEIQERIKNIKKD
jgi:hypothetical protein